MRSYILVEETAHDAGRALHAIGDKEFTAAVTADVDAELRAIEHAELGDLTDRARQAVLLDRADASPSQVAAATALFEDNPFGADQLFTDFDPTAAAVVAAHWLAAAAEVVGERIGIDPTQVVEEADNIEALPVTTPTLVLERVASGERVHDVVVSLVRGAIAARAGELPDLDALLAQVTDAEARAAQGGDRADEIREALMPRRTTPLDPTRPARDLLEDLLAGIRGCWLLWLEHGDQDDGDEPDDVDMEGVADQEQDYEAEDERLTDAFLDAVREQAARDASRLG